MARGVVDCGRSERREDVYGLLTSSRMTTVLLTDFVQLTAKCGKTDLPVCSILRSNMIYPPHHQTTRKGCAMNASRHSWSRVFQKSKKCQTSFPFASCPILRRIPSIVQLVEQPKCSDAVLPLLVMIMTSQLALPYRTLRRYQRVRQPLCRISLHFAHRCSHSPSK